MLTLTISTIGKLYGINSNGCVILIYIKNAKLIILWESEIRTGS